MRPLEASLGVAIAAVGAGTADSALFVAAALGRVALPIVVAGHLSIGAALVAWVVCSPSCRADLRLPLLLAVTTIFFGPFGAAGSTLTMLLGARYARHAVGFDEWYSSLFPEDLDSRSPALKASELAEDDRGGRDAVTPFADILCFGDHGQKQELLAVVSREFRPEFVPILRLAIGDSNNGIRVQAASAVARIEDQFLPRSVGLAAAVSSNPLSHDAVLALARFHDDFAGAGLFDAARARESREQALAAYADCLTLEPGDDRVRVAVARLLIADGRFADAAAAIEGWLQRDRPSPQLLVRYMHTLYRLSRFDELRAVASRCADAVNAGDELPLEVLEVVRLWTEAA